MATAAVVLVTNDVTGTTIGTVTGSATVGTRTAGTISANTIFEENMNINVIVTTTTGAGGVLGVDYLFITEPEQGAV